VARHDGRDALNSSGPPASDARRRLRPDPWLGIEFRHLAALEAVAEEVSFKRAASRLGYTQSAISQQIAALERVVGQKLVERPGGPSPVSLTPAGRLLLHHAETIGARLAAAYADLAAMARGGLGTIRVGSFHSLGGKLVSEILRNFDRHWPDIDVDLSEIAGDRELLILLEQGELDVVFAHLPLPPGAFEATPLVADDYVLVVPRGAAKTARPATMSMTELTKLPLIGFKICRGCDPLVAHARTLALEIDFVYRADNVPTIEGMIVSGLGLAVLPRLATDLMSAEVEVLELGSLNLPARTIAAVRHADRASDNAVLKFVEAARLVCSGRQERSHLLQSHIRTVNEYHYDGSQVKAVRARSATRGSTA
jgi:DNA-binding transcriptional LysR family regulator